ncbi:precorrin-3B synthase [Nonomuraea glycinis]|uniref:Precorrin-3B synthase n=1 Tax=Nonomuraea glycinis TaxID=2047744 RepID=A0A918A5X7_9ACTN|nr:precorrin-3B synthase [Nonomuraea glycinis]GGP07770.1 precorrin-3B synthase [Nonomuraea glycinis]
MSIADFSGRVRPDACPGALQVHEAADGPLARVRLPGGAVTAPQLREIAACADELGSGVIELTSRANVQVRALRSASAFAERIASAGLLPSAAHERVRNIVGSPLSGRGSGGSLDTQPMVDALDQALCSRARLAALPGRFLFALDDGTGDVIGLGADVTFAAEGSRLGRLLLAGSDLGLAAHPDTVIDLMIAAAEAFLDERASHAAWRIHELENGPRRIAARLNDMTTESPAAPAILAEASRHADLRDSPAIRRAGRIAQRDGRVALEALVPLGRLTPAQAVALANAGTTVRLTPWRTAVLLNLSPGEADRAANTLEEAGLVVDPASPWAGVTACTGRPGCAKSLADVQADARRWVSGLDTAPRTPVHWAGCERRCGLPRGQVVQMIATEDGYQERQQ